MKISIVSILFFLVSGCTFADKYETYALDGKIISLNVSNCKLNYGANSLDLGYEGSCYFVKEYNSKSVRMEYYENIDSYVFLIVANMLPKDPEIPMTMLGEGCGSTVKALLISTEKAIISEKDLTDTVTCPSFGIDQKIFYILSH